MALTTVPRMRCVLLSRHLDLLGLFPGPLGALADRLDIRHDTGRPDGGEAAIALAWNPPAGAFARHPGLRAVCSIGAGVDGLLATPDLPDDVDVVRVVDPDQAALMSGFVLWHVVGHQRGFADYARNQQAGLWRRLGQRAPGSVPVALLGYGQMGRRVAADLAALGFPVLAWSRSALTSGPAAGIRHFHGPDGLAAMLPEAEVLVNLLPLTPETRGLLDAGLFGRMRPGGYLVQVGRGDHHVEADLLAALADGTLAGAALDVFATEPLPAGHPFWTHPAIRITPHEACEASGEAVAATLLATADALATGRVPPGAVDRALGY